MSDRPRPAALLAALALLGTLLVGGALGYTIGSRPRPMRSKQMALFGISRTELLDSLRLDQQQRIRLDRILDVANGQAERSIARMMDEVQQVTRDARDSVRAGLSQPQQVRFDSLLTRAIPLRPRSPLPPKSTTP